MFDEVLVLYEGFDSAKLNLKKFIRQVGLCPSISIVDPMASHWIRWNDLMRKPSDIVQWKYSLSSESERA